SRVGGWGIFGLSDSSAGVAGIAYWPGSTGVFGQSYEGTSGQFIIDNALTNSSNALEVSNSQTGKAVNILQTGTGIGLYSNSKSNFSGFFENTNAANNATTLEVISNGTGRAIVGRSNLPGAVNAGVIDGFTNIYGGNAVFGHANRVGGWGIFGLSDSSAGVAGIAYWPGSTGVFGQSYEGTSGQFIIDNALTNSSNALEVSNSQTGKAVNIFQTGTGIGLYA